MSDSRIRLSTVWQPLFVWAAWAWLSAALVRFVLVWAPRVPLRDDMELVPFLYRAGNVIWAQLWDLHNEHRVPLPKFVAASLFDMFNDVRAPMILNALLLCALAAAMIQVARKIRGSTSITDVVFPLLWLSTGNAENLLMAFQLALILPTVLACTMILVVVRRTGAQFTIAEALVLIACLLFMPLCGGPGITQWPAYALATLYFFFKSPAASPARRIFGIGFVAAAAVVAAYLVGYQSPHTENPAHDVVRLLRTAWRVVAAAFGPAGAAWWPWSGLACAALAVITCAVTYRAWRERADDRPRIMMLLCAVLAVATMALAIGWARGGAGPEVGFAARYVTLPGPWVAAGVFACIAFGERLTRIVVPGTMALALLFAEVTQNHGLGERYARDYAQMGRAFSDDITGPLPVHRTILLWTGRVYPNRTRLHQILGLMARAHVAPFDTAGEPTRRKYTESIFDVAPEAIQSPVPPLKRYLEDLCDVLAVPTDSRLFLVVPDGTQRFSAAFGVPPLWIQRGATKGVRAIVRSEATGEVLFERTIDPVNVPTERGPQSFEVNFAAGSTQRIVLEMTWPDGAPHVADWGYWADAWFE